MTAEEIRAALAKDGPLNVFDLDCEAWFPTPDAPAGDGVYFFMDGGSPLGDATAYWRAVPGREFSWAEPFRIDVRSDSGELVLAGGTDWYASTR